MSRDTDLSHCSYDAPSVLNDLLLRVSSSISEILERWWLSVMTLDQSSEDSSVSKTSVKVSQLSGVEGVHHVVMVGHPL